MTTNVVTVYKLVTGVWIGMEKVVNGDDVVDADDDDDCMNWRCHYSEYYYSSATQSPFLPLHSRSLHCSACHRCPAQHLNPNLLPDLEQRRRAPQVGQGSRPHVYRLRVCVTSRPRHNMKEEN